MDREQEGASGRGDVTQEGRELAALPQVESVEGFVEKHEWLRGEQGKGDENPLTFPLR